ncbi:MAG TPA: M56 family metallopeptidase, partial [Thermoanaerobaculia bacterium]|nr:M56 family metallopeptidase [Thermoanaerobaculia bacterium]
MTPLLVDLASWWLQAGLLLGAGLVLPGMVRLRDPGARLRLGQLLLAIAILLPLLQPRASSQGDGNSGTGPVFSLAILVTGKPPVAAASVETVVLVLLATGVALRLAWLGAGLLRLRSLRRRSRPLAPLSTPIVSAIARTGATAEVLVSPEVASPVTLGWLRPAILLPESFMLLAEAEQEAVACHELLHVKRRDSWALLLEEGARALLWAQPAAWGVLSGISLSREQAVDRAAVDSTGDLRAYLRALAVLARLSQESPAAALPFHTRSHLVRRVAHLAKEVPMSRTRASLATAVAAASLLLVGAAGAAAFPFGDDSQPPAAKAAPAKGSGVVADDNDILKVGGDVKEPVQISRVQPTYPEEARKNGVQGIVKLSAVIDAKGSVTRIEPIESPDPTLAAAAVDAVKKWTYKPAT